MVYTNYKRIFLESIMHMDWVPSMFLQVDFLCAVGDEALLFVCTICFGLYLRMLLQICNIRWKILTFSSTWCPIQSIIHMKWETKFEENPLLRLTYWNWKSIKSQQFSFLGVTGFIPQISNITLTSLEVLVIGFISNQSHLFSPWWR